MIFFQTCNDLNSSPLRIWHSSDHKSSHFCSRTGDFLSESSYFSPSVLRPIHIGSQVPWRQSVQSQPLRAWKSGLTTSHGSQVLSMTWMLTWPHFLEVKLETCVESWVEPKARPNPQHKSCKYFCIKYSKYDFNEYKSYFDGFFKLKSWDFASTLGLVNLSGLWDPMWTNPKYVHCLWYLVLYAYWCHLPYFEAYHRLH